MSDKVVYKNFQKKGNERHYKTPYKRLYTKMKRLAESKNIEVTMTYEEFLKFTECSQCYYCNAKLVWVKHGKKATSYNLDRIDNNKGYSLDNCIECCWRCNNSKSNRYTHEEWFGMTEYFRNKKEI